MTNYNVEINFNSYKLPYVFDVSDPQEGMKATKIEGTRGDGCIIIPGGKKSQEIRIRGKLFEEDYKDLTTAMNTLRTSVTTNSATLVMRHKEGVSWIQDWSYTVRRIDEIRFPQSLRIGVQEYEITFIVTSY